ncbi:cysteine hydrolase family protein [Alicyclobacillus sp. SO9]|uniref:cysteine hydrolase family protein n=1 Tax=Alicyclobacillus sp. SO9 TaxID=2665646 RepID=UPI0018E8CE8F|nr:cysteine hydrolase family protein [Alicyclobacillus sp. SO9]QQE80683.1 cysteine hydrolase family protein [Alicyclobacillus sp. SO9]
MKKALICLDVQEEFLGQSLDYIATLCQRYLNRSGDDYDAVVLTHWVYPELEGKDTLMLSHPKALVVGKSTFSGLTAEVQQLFQEKGIEEVHVAGIDAEMAVLATMFSVVDAGYKVKILERLVASYHGRNWESMTIARHAIGTENVIPLGGDRVYV